MRDEERVERSVRMREEIGDNLDKMGDQFSFLRFMSETENFVLNSLIY